MIQKKWLHSIIAIGLCMALLLPSFTAMVSVSALDSRNDDLSFAYEVGRLQEAETAAFAELPADGLARVSLSPTTPISIKDLDPHDLYICFDLRVTRTDGVTGPGSLNKVVNGWFMVKSKTDSDNTQVLKVDSPVQNGIADPDQRIAGEWIEMCYPLSSLDTSVVTNISNIEVADYNDFPKANPPISTGIKYEVKNARVLDASRGKDGSIMEDYAQNLRIKLKTEIDTSVDESLYSDTLLAAYQAIIANANTVYQNSAAILSELEETIHTVQMARVETEEDILETLSAKVNVSFDRTLFTEDSLTYYDAVCNAGRALIGVPASKQQIQDAIKQLDDAMDRLEVIVVPDIVYGDIDGTDGVTAADALQALQFATKKISLNAGQQAAGNVDGTNGITAADALMLLQYATQKIDDILPSLSATINTEPITFCNPLNLNYMYSRDYYLDGTANPDPDNITGYQSREAADPALVVFNNEYYLFASHNEGYWVSTDLMKWEFIYVDITKNEACANFQHFAPATCVVGDTLYLTHSQNGIMIKTKNPRDPDAWEVVGRPDNWSDPGLYYDDPAEGGDGYVYVYQGSTPTGNLTVAKLDPNNNMQKVGNSKKLFGTDPDQHGWEVAGENNLDYDGYSYVEGAWMNKYNGKYYLTYGAPTTNANIYADGCYVSDSPMGPFTYFENSPVAFKPSGYMVGAGHGCLFEDLNGNWWKVDSVVIMTKGWERRLAIFPATFDEDGDLYTNTVRSDYPTYAPTTNKDPFNVTGPNWNLLSYNKSVTASSSLRPATCAVDENMRSWWSAETGNVGEWLQVDLGQNYPVRSIQVNFADQDIPNTVYGRTESFSQKYLMEFSQDGEHWFTMVDRQDNTEDIPHDYIEFADAVIARYVRITNKGPVPGHGKFAISGLRVFGDGQGTAPATVTNFKVARNVQDGRLATLSWQKAPDAQGYIIRYGVKEDALYTHYQVIGEDHLAINGLNKGVDYYFSIDAYNESGIVVGTETVFVESPPEPEPPKTEEITIAEFTNANDKMMFLYGYCYQVDWATTANLVDCSSVTSANGAKEDYYFDAIVTLNAVPDADVDLANFVGSYGLNLRSADGKEANLFMTYSVVMDNANTFHIRIPLSEMSKKDIDWTQVKDMFMLFYLSEDYRAESNQPNPYASISISDAKIVQLVPVNE